MGLGKEEDLNRWDFKSVMEVMTRDSRPVAYLWSSRFDEIMPAEIKASLKHRVSCLLLCLI